MIRRIIVDHAREHGAAKRGEGLQVPLDEARLSARACGAEVEALDEALNLLAKIDPPKTVSSSFVFSEA